jgi:hypothetical protein
MWLARETSTCSLPLMMSNTEKVLHILPTGEGKQSAGHELEGETDGKVAQGGGRHVGKADRRYDAFVCDSWAAIVD